MLENSDQLEKEKYCFVHTYRSGLKEELRTGLPMTQFLPVLQASTAPFLRGGSGVGCYAVEDLIKNPTCLLGGPSRSKAQVAPAAILDENNRGAIQAQFLGCPTPFCGGGRSQGAVEAFDTGSMPFILSL